MLTWIILGRLYMIRLITIIFIFLTSCAHIQYENLPMVAKELVLGVDDIKVTQDFFDSFEYSFAKVKIGRYGVAIFVLSEINDKGEFLWISSTNERMYTKNGKIFKLYSDSEYSFTLLESPDTNFLTQDNMKVEYFIEFHNPHAVFKQEALFKKYRSKEDIFYLGKYIPRPIEVSEYIKTFKFRWAFSNKYWFDNKNNVIRSKQYIHPNLGQIDIEYYYKY